MINENEKNGKNGKIKGGKAIASGGYGCVFSPALKCEGSKKREKNKISKLMTKKHTLSEYEEIEKVKRKLINIPNYTDYFLVNDITVCKPEKLTKFDLAQYKKKCRALPKDKIYDHNINESLDKLLLLNIPNGGVALDDYNYNSGSFDKWYKTSDNLIKLLKNGIIPMNTQNYFHCDVKDSNILIKDNDDEFKLRLIDWGLSTEYTPFIDAEIPKSWFTRSIQFNVPFSVILFTDYFEERYIKYIEKYDKIDENILRPFVYNYIIFWLKKKGSGHYTFINEIMYILFSNDIEGDNNQSKIKIIENEFTLFYITNYLVKILHKYTYLENSKIVIKLNDYLDNVFINIVDVHGLLTCYFPLIDILFINYKNLSKSQHKIFITIKNIFTTYLFSPITDKSEITKIIEKLEDLTLLIKGEINSDTFHTINSSTSKTTTSTRKARGIIKHKKTNKKFFHKTSKKILRDNNLFLLTQLKK
uniref:Protein kinase domain-containing protein n=1 Tax=viral metagenome TaxID=1070528 RepID=A0A6C0IFZ3_9ZZZZ